MFEKKASTQVEIAAVLALRWSGRAFDPDRPVEQHKLAALLEAVRFPRVFSRENGRSLLNPPEPPTISIPSANPGAGLYHLRSRLFRYPSRGILPSLSS
jgi:hypothetical protein